MTKYVNADALIAKLIARAITAQSDSIAVMLDVCGIVRERPAADVVEVCGAEWEKDRDTLKCSACGFGYFPTNSYFRNGECTGNKGCVFTFCPSCGACMSGGKTDGETV